MNLQNIKTLLSLTKFSLISTFRNPTAVFFGFFFPFIFILIFGLIGSGSNKYSIGVLDSSLQNNPIFEAIEKTDIFELDREITDEEINEQLEKGQLPAAIDVQEVIPNPDIPEFKTYNIVLKTSAADPQDANTVRLILSNVISEINSATILEQNRIANLSIENVEGRKYTQIDFILPGQLNFSLLSTGVMGIAFSLIALRRTLVLKRMFATPAPRWVILGSKALSSIVMGIIQAVLIITVGHFAFGFTLVNGLVTFASMVLLAVAGLIVFMGLGLIVSSLANNEDSAAPIANLITLPQFLLGGSFFPTDAFPDFLQPIAKIMPMTFLNDAMRGIAFEGSSFQTVLPQLLGLAVWGIITYAIAIKIFKWE